MGGNTSGGMNMGGNNMLPMMFMMNGGSGSIFDGMLDGMFDFGSTEEPETADDDEEEEDW